MASFSHKGYDIHVTNEGRFISSKDDFTSTADTLEQVKAAIDREIAGGKTKVKLSMPVIGRLKKQSYGYSGREPKSDKVGKAILIGINRTTGELQFERLEKGFTLESVIADTPENNVRLADYLEVNRRYDEMNAVIDALEVKHRGYGRIDAGKYDQAVTSLKELYEKSKKGKV